jgi:hypothetical protein
MNKPVIIVADLEVQPRPAAFAATGPATERFDARMGSRSTTWTAG